jgi:hypothetical protein
VLAKSVLEVLFFPHPQIREAQDRESAVISRIRFIEDLLLSLVVCSYYNIGLKECFINYLTIHGQFTKDWRKARSKKYKKAEKVSR